MSELILILVHLLSLVASADDVIPAENKVNLARTAVIEAVKAPCGMLENFMGEVQILDHNRTQLIDATLNAPIPCGSWVSVNRGWAQIRHLNGPHISLSDQTFVQLPDFRKDTEFKGDHVIIYRGQVYAQAGNGAEEFRLVSSTGRARVRRGKMIMIVSSSTASKNETQLIALQNFATLENRFENSRKVKVRAGEATNLNFKLLRVIPTLPTAISVASIRPKLVDLRISQTDQLEAIRSILNRQGRKFPTIASDDKEESLPLDERNQVEEKVIQRKLASTGKKSIYTRHLNSPEDAKLRAYWIKKMVGGEDAGERVLYPDKYYGKTQRVHVEVEDPGVKFDQKLQKQQDAEKKRLIEELSQIRVE